MRNFIIALSIFSSFVITSTAKADYPVYTPEEYAAMVCTSPVTIVWNDDYIPPAPMCAMMMISEMENVLVQCAYGSAEHCLELTNHVVAWYVPCFEKAAKIEQQP